ncbi:hypothetical protein F4V43_15900 [Paenibacillus spiritus]|uniref:HTTM-like domain-containing protein n=1 Tax=Paenibacillus spiritus TaxID=2496557 RepID=A0A5J5G0F5_9BACL|nr:MULTISPECIES: sporulation-delaying protein SdpB family protein [Paenibacillus]KAA8999804.1 hypothetical protein F4V43_15900 [Paenibacillus spiritus]
MLKRLNSIPTLVISGTPPWTNVYGLARTLIALSLLLTLITNDVTTLFKPAAGINEYPSCSVYAVSIFCVLPNNYPNLELLKWISVLILLIVASGWRPRFTGILHWWVASSLQNTGITLDGGEQVATVLTLLLIPVTLFDHRKWHWLPPRSDNTMTSTGIPHLISFLFLFSIRVQMAIIYFNAALSKLKNKEWIDGTAIYYYFHDPMLGLNSFLLSLLNPLIESSFVVLLTWGTIIVELLLGSGIVAHKEKRFFFLYLGLALHTLIAICLGLYSFSLVMFAGLILAFRPFEHSFGKKISMDSLKEVHQ